MYMIVSFFIVFLLTSPAYSQEGLVKTTYPNGQTESEINYSDNLRQGEARFYYENGRLKEERLYVNGRVEGLVKKYNENGKLKELINIEDGRREGPTSLFNDKGEYVSDIYFEKGVQVVEKENIYLTQSEISKSEKKETQPVNKVNKKKVDYEMPPPEEKEEMADDPAVYFTVEVMPEPIGGTDAIKKKLIYPPKARENGIQGVVEVSVEIDEFGEVTRAEVIKGIGHGCDETARIAVYYTKFKPGLQKGKPVKVRTVIPVKFDLKGN